MFEVEPGQPASTKGAGHGHGYAYPKLSTHLVNVTRAVPVIGRRARLGRRAAGVGIRAAD
jgi:hypothetical protein